MTDADLATDVRIFAHDHLPNVPYDRVLRAARVAKDIHLYDEIARRTRIDGSHLPSSFNGASLYAGAWGLDLHQKGVTRDVWRLGAANASPWIVAALLGCPLSLPINYWFGRRGAIAVAAFLILASSIGAIFVSNWKQMFCVRIVNGLGMGIKAVSTPILASETAVGFWRGSAILAWQLWVAFGIMAGFAFNMIFSIAKDDKVILRLIQGAPLVPSLALLVLALGFCPESPRYHLMKGPNYSVQKAYEALRKVRNTELQALRDLYMVYKALEQERVGVLSWDPHVSLSPGFFWVMRDFLSQYGQLFRRRRLYNALLSACTVNLAQQLCGVNVFVFYSGSLFTRDAGSEPDPVSKLKAMAYSLGFGAINFLFALPAVKSIDTLGRRKWLLATLPFMSLFMLGAGLSYFLGGEESEVRKGVTAGFLYLFAIAYSPGLGPIPFTLASEGFPLTHREAGTSCAISTNLFFAGLLSICYPRIDVALGQAGSLGLFSGLNIVALVLVFLLVEETKQLTLEELDHVFAVSKRDFMRFQLAEYLPWLLRQFLCGSQGKPPVLYKDMVSGPGPSSNNARTAYGMPSYADSQSLRAQRSRTGETDRMEVGSRGDVVEMDNPGRYNQNYSRAPISHGQGGYGSYRPDSSGWNYR
ncbi:hypothetical protein CDD80_1968 [Ophiocordyceps camponoti-rufipedis]|uniref:Major facilitator superfamily (MFS) profile domain-containing protein n=1 Tax=Ophiocordyceps camponoti-rufipedis TaxID=2004952 RepID=A0A2C5XXC2_9HYPO|nr:hypothetical protein CDD80_1968 [Ophiocordyceps camponoti-rufipedis]